MQILLGLTHTLGSMNAAVLAVARGLGAACMGLMVVIILAQVFFRYAVGTALAWPEEASRFLMLWSTGLMAATALRRGGFVSIDMLIRLMPRAVAAGLSVILLCLTLLVLVFGLQIAFEQTTGLGGRFDTDSLKVPASFDLTEWRKVPKGWMMASMVVGLGLLVSVAFELILRNLVILFGGHSVLRDIPDSVILGAE